LLFTPHPKGKNEHAGEKHSLDHATPAVGDGGSFVPIFIFIIMIALVDALGKSLHLSRHGVI
jgi:hypothetical protein